MSYYTTYEECGEEVEADYCHNGVCMCYHYVHCGWGHVAGEDDIYHERKDNERI